MRTNDPWLDLVWRVVILESAVVVALLNGPEWLAGAILGLLGPSAFSRKSMGPTSGD
jgi:hypothetical protein